MFLAIPLLLFGCYPGGPNEGEDLSMVVTTYDTAFNFQQPSTFSLPDEVVDITGDMTEGQLPKFLGDPHSQDVLGAIRRNMTAYGWVEVDEAANPDVIILPSVVTAPGYNWWYDSLRWNWYYPFEFTGWQYTYGLYGGSYTTGTVIIRITYPDGTAAGIVPVPWTSLCNGMIDGTTSTLTKQINAGIDKAFHQSPYLQQ